jgi:hypothetical protein
VLRPRSGPELIDAAVSLTRRHIGPLVTLAAINVMLDAAATALRLTMAPDAAEISAASFASLVMQFATGGIMGGAMARAASDAYLHGTAEPGPALRAALRRPWTLAWTGAAMGVLVAFGLMLLVIPGLLLVARYFAVAPAIVIEDRGGWAAFRRSHELARGRVWKLFLTVGIAFVLYFALMLGAEVVFGELVGEAWASTVANATLGVIIVPALTALAVVAYYDARIEKEAFDLEMLATGTGTPAPDASLARPLRGSAGSNIPT